MNCPHCGIISFKLAKKCPNCNANLRGLAENAMRAERRASFSIYTPVAALADSSHAELDFEVEDTTRPAKSDLRFTDIPRELDQESGDFDLDLSDAAKAYTAAVTPSPLEAPAVLADRERPLDLDFSLDETADEIEVEGLGFEPFDTTPEIVPDVEESESMIDFDLEPKTAPEIEPTLDLAPEPTLVMDETESGFDASVSEPALELEPTLDLERGPTLGLESEPAMELEPELGFEKHEIEFKLDEEKPFGEPELSLDLETGDEKFGSGLEEPRAESGLPLDLDIESEPHLEIEDAELKLEMDESPAEPEFALDLELEKDKPRDLDLRLDDLKLEMETGETPDKDSDELPKKDKP